MFGACKAQFLEPTPERLPRPVEPHRKVVGHYTEFRSDRAPPFLVQVNPPNYLGIIRSQRGEQPVETKANCSVSFRFLLLQCIEMSRV